MIVNGVLILSRSSNYFTLFIFVIVVGCALFVGAIIGSVATVKESKFFLIDVRSFSY